MHMTKRIWNIYKVFFRLRKIVRTYFNWFEIVGRAKAHTPFPSTRSGIFPSLWSDTEISTEKPPYSNASILVPWYPDTGYTVRSYLYALLDRQSKVQWEYLLLVLTIVQKQKSLVRVLGAHTAPHGTAQPPISTKSTRWAVWMSDNGAFRLFPSPIFARGQQSFALACVRHDQLSKMLFMSFLSGLSSRRILAVTAALPARAPVLQARDTGRSPDAPWIGRLPQTASPRYC